ncbi:MAG TPA: DUF4129 domain-containing protein, partial [Pyrinomonadaceae bacterium]|nr:DUF4129 domain-containing protein [Pyrinomonadaceae bacterium]
MPPRARRRSPTKTPAARAARFLTRRFVIRRRFVVVRPFAFALAFAFVTCSALVAARAASTFEDYHERVGESATGLDSLAAPEEEATAEERTEMEAETVATVRELLPRREQVEWRGVTVEVDNGWLHDALDAYGRASKPDERARLLAQAAARLTALEERLHEVESVSAAAAPRDKAAEKARLEEILRRPEFNQKPDSKPALQRLGERLRKWLDDLFPDPQPLAPGQTPAWTRAAQIVVYAVAALVVGFVLWRYGPRVWRARARLRVTPEDDGERVVLGEVLAPEQTAADLLSEADELARRGDLRGAIRRAYVALLCELADRRIIRLARHRTNRDYLEAVRRARADLYAEVRPLTADFERHWYGS